MHVPKLLIINQFVFLLFAADLFESRKHIHVEVRKGNRRYVAKFWLEPEVKLLKRGNLSDKELAQAGKLINENYDTLVKQIEKFMRGEKIKTIKK